MKTEKEKMLNSELYNPSDEELVNARNRASERIHQYNESSTNEAIRINILKDLLKQIGSNVQIIPPFYCDYGSNISLGHNVFFNFGCVVLDVTPVTIEDNVLLGPYVQIYTASHPMDWETRQQGLEFGNPITIKANSWIGGGAIICPGVTIGEQSVIGAGSVVTRDIPDNVFAAGNPCKVIKPV